MSGRAGIQCVRDNMGMKHRLSYIVYVLSLCLICGLSSPVAAENVEIICYTCHNESFLADGYRVCSAWVKNGHPVYIVPSEKVKVPKNFPLNDKGQLFCGTCHTAGVIDKGETDRQPYIYTRKVFLRHENVNSSFCKQCHLQKGGEDRLAGRDRGDGYKLLHDAAAEKKEKVVVEMTFNHPVDITTKRIPKRIIEYGGNTGTSKDMLICETCHRVHRASDENLLVLSIDNSELCGICHPAMWAGDRESASTKGTHPVNVLPSTAVISRNVIAHGGRIRARGKMICTTCHKIHNAPVEKGLLVLNNDRDAFCIECHSVEEKAIKNTKHDLRRTAPNEKNILKQSARKSGICSPCHLVHGGTGAKIWAKEIVDPNSDAISQLCESCHSRFNCAKDKQVGDFSHPVNVELQKADEVRSSLPLYSRTGIQAGVGFVTCATCHDSHRWDPKSKSKVNAISKEGDNTNSFLRQRNLKSSLCYKCHPEKKLIRQTKHDPQLTTNYTEDNRGLCEKCHSVHNANFYMLWNQDVGSGEDNVSKICNSCHAEGKIAEEKLLTGYNHPVNVSILDIGHYIDTELPLFDVDLSRNERGLLLCNTCHDTHRWDPKATRVKDFTKAQATAGNSFLRVAANDKDESLCDSCHNDRRWIKSTEHDLSITAPKEKNLQGKTVAETGVCGACHANHRGQNPLILWNRKEGPGEDKLTKLCNSCHVEGEVGQKKQLSVSSHPLRIPMPEKRSTHLPLFDEDLKVSDQGNIYCTTCHNIHQWDPNQLANGPGKNVEGDDATSFLRVSNDKGYSLCIDCHPDKEMIENTEHDLSVSAPQAKNILGQTVDKSGLCGTCHLAHNSVITQQLWARKLGPGDDMISRLCNSCHSKDNCAQSKLVNDKSHPLNVSILSADGETDLPLYTPDGRRDDDNGRVFCSTCHSAHKWDSTLQARGSGKLEEGTPQNSFLRLPNVPKPFLCGNCHQKHLSIQNSPHDLATNKPQAKNITGQTAGEGGVCSPCHLPHNTPSKIRMWAQKTGPWMLPGWQGDYAEMGHYGVVLCTGCHAPGEIAGEKIPRQALHPKNLFVLLKEAASIPAAQTLPYFDYPLGQRKIRISASAIMAGVKPRFPVYTSDGHIGQNGDITCPTCHNPHLVDALATSSPIKNKFQGNFLRKDTAKNFCTDCHGYEAIYRFAYYHNRRTPPTGQKPAGDKSPHLKKGACTACHTSSDPGKNSLKAGGDINTLCNECHQGNHSSETHPVGISVTKAKMKKPKNLPLYGNDQINCLTCHQLNGHDKLDKSGLARNPYFLRRPGNKLLTFFREKDVVENSPFSANMQPRFSPQQGRAAGKKKKPKKKPKEKKPKSYAYALCYECHAPEQYLQFNVHRYQIIDKTKINHEMCLLCHNGIPNLSATRPGDFKLKTSLDKYCISCHPKQVELHPAQADHFKKRITEGFLNIIRTFAKTGNYFIPLTSQRMACSTCHNPHQRGVSRHKATMRGEDERWRLRFVGYEMCAICHRGSFGQTTIESPF